MHTLAIFCSRETPEQLLPTLLAASAACVAADVGVDVMVNGNRALAEFAAQYYRRNANTAYRVFHIAAADKANAWNQHLHALSRDEGTDFYIDGGVRLRPDALLRLQAVIDAEPQVLAACALRKNDTASYRAGSFWGCFCALTAEGRTLLRRRNIRLPYGIYRTDSTLGSFMSFGLDPVRNPWDPHRYIAHDTSGLWSTPRKRFWHPGDISDTLRRRRRPARGVLENRAVKYLLTVKHMQPEQLPNHVRRLIESWQQEAPDEATQLLRSSATLRRALSELQAIPDIEARMLLPERIETSV